MGGGVIKGHLLLEMGMHPQVRGRGTDRGRGRGRGKW